MKQLKRKTLSSALLQALGAGVTLTVIATAANAQQAQKVEKIEVTGSNIKRVDLETVAPVEIISKEAIARTGQPTVADVIRNVPAITGGSFNESFSNSFAPGAAGVSLRGLGQKSTLVLLNGRRVSGYGFAQNIQDTFVDLNAIPSSAVERIEILKDGASAIYGSDAVAGVINIILRQDYRGGEASIFFGTSEGKDEFRASGVFGWGDLAKDKFNVFGVLDYYDREETLQSDTKFLHTRDMRGYGGGRNFHSLTGGGTWRQLSATNALTNFHRATTDCAFNRIDGPTAVSLGLIAGPLGNTGFNQPGNTFCSQDQNYALSALPGTERLGFLGRGSLAFSNTTTGYAEVSLSQNKTDQTFTAPFFQSSVLPQGGAVPYAFNINFAPGSAGNPFDSNARYVGALYDLGLRTSEINSDAYRFLAGLNYTFMKWDLDSAFSFSKSETESIGKARMSLSGVGSAFNVPTTRQPPIPLSASSLYNIDRYTSNSDAVRNSLTLDPVRQAESELWYIDTKASRELWQMAGGAAGLAVGFEYREESLEDRPDPNALAGNIIGQGVTATNGERDTTAFYAELSLPITKSVEVQAAVRYDDYSDYGSNTSPKIGFRWRPFSTFMVRGNWGEGFRAPNLVEISPSIATFFTQVTDPEFGGAIRNVSGAFTGNKDLKPEESKSATIGFVWEPIRDFSVGVNYYDIELENIVVANCCQAIVNSGDPTRVIRDPVTNEIVAVLGGYENQDKTETKGIDFDARYTRATDIGRLTGRINVTYIDSYKVNGTEIVGSNADGTTTLPRTRGVFGIDWDYRAFSATMNMNYTHGYYQTFLGASFFTPQDPQFQNGTYPEKVRHHRTVDFFVRYNVNKNFSVNASLINAEDKTPPYDPGFSATNLYDFGLFDIRGRQWRVGLRYTM